MKMVFLLCLCFVLYLVAIVKANNPNCEFYLTNKIPGKSIYVKFYPTSAIFNGNGIEPDVTRYSVITSADSCSRRGSPAEYKLKYLVGLDGYALENRGSQIGYFEVPPDTIGGQYDRWLLLGNDASQNSYLDGLFGYGRYMLEVWVWNFDSAKMDSCFSIVIDWLDFNYPYSNGSQDLTLKIYRLSPLDIRLRWSATVEGDELPLFGTGSPPYNGGIQVYKQYHRYVNGNWEGYNLNGEHPPSRGNSVSDKYFLTFPIDGRNLPSPYTIPRHDSAGVFKGNLTIDTNVSTPDSLFESPAKIVMSKMTYLKVNAEDSLILSTPSYPQAGYVDLIIEDSSTLDLHGKIIIEDRNKLTLKATAFSGFNLVLQLL